ncbi:DUF4446 family protein [Desulfitibacter alkalitolerans]|uniref:DUF4446 family protein n=1 Tax=Desulfitibacter alkalitolerans TaxID=264641 RepID=UPI000683D650|nr:DUF4446 family protein [Desulfitibacter alkalitolerans]
MAINWYGIHLDTTTHIYITLALIIVIALLLIWQLIITFKYLKLRKKYNTYMHGSDGRSMEQKIDAYHNDFNMLNSTIKDLDKQLSELNRKNMRNFNKVGFVRFSAFSEVGSDLSFAIALMDSYNNGFVISSIYGRDDNRFYAKPLENGKSKYRLSEEEELAISRALES